MPIILITKDPEVMEVFKDVRARLRELTDMQIEELLTGSEIEACGCEHGMVTGYYLKNGTPEQLEVIKSAVVRRFKH